MYLHSDIFLFQYLTKKLGVDPILYGYLEMTFAVFQLAGGPLFGRFGDLFGGRAAFTLAFTSAAATYGLLGVSYNIPVLFISRIPSLFMHAMQGRLLQFVKYLFDNGTQYSSTVCLESDSTCV